MTAETYLLSRCNYNWPYIGFVFFSTLVLYDFPSLFFARHAFSENESERHKWIIEHKRTLAAASVTGLAGTATTLFFFPLKFIFSFAPVTIIAFAYFFPQTHLRSIAGLKAAVVTVVWTSVTCYYPLLIQSDFKMLHAFGEGKDILLLQNFLFIFPLSIIFNVRDIETDEKAGVKTIPVLFGARNTVIICICCLFLFATVVMCYWGISRHGLALTASAIISLLFILRASPARADYYYSLWLDGMILLQAGMVYVMH